MIAVVIGDCVSGTFSNLANFDKELSAKLSAVFHLFYFSSVNFTVYMSSYTSEYVHTSNTW